MGLRSALLAVSKPPHRRPGQRWNHGDALSANCRETAAPQAKTGENEYSKADGPRVISMTYPFFTDDWSQVSLGASQQAVAPLQSPNSPPRPEGGNSILLRSYE